MLTENITLVLGRITPVKNKYFGNYGFPNSVVNNILCLLLRREWGTIELVTTDLLSQNIDRIPSNTPGAEPPRDAKDSGSARSHSMHLETSSPDRPKMVTYMEPKTVSSYISVKCTRRTLRMPNFTRATHAQPSLSNFPWRDSDFGERTRSRGTTQLEQNFPTFPQNQKTKLTHCSIYVPMRTISSPHTK